MLNSMAYFSIIFRVLAIPLLILFASPPFTVHQVHNLVAADHKLIEAECHNSETPATCLKCVESAGGAAEKADGTGIAAIVVNCSICILKTLEANMTAFANNETDAKLKKIYQDCSELYKNATIKLEKSKHELENHKYEIAESLVTDALTNDHLKCHDELNCKRVAVSVDAVYGMRVYEELSEAACRIIERL